MMSASILQGASILVLEDEVLLRKRLISFLEKKGAEVLAVGKVEEARRSLRDLRFDFFLCDINLPDGNGLDLLREGAIPETTAALIMTAEGGIESAVEAMRLGARDYLTKPFEYAELPILFERARQARKAQRAEEHRRKEQSTERDLFFGRSLDPLKAQLERILKADQRLREGLPPVLIEGETGTGKTTLARWLHREGPRCEGPLIEVNCSALPENLAESELFGHERGAFTDARSARIGLFEAADGGTLFLDEIPSLSAGIQAKVLIAVEDGKIRRVGGNREIRVDVRLIAATNQSLPELVKEGAFREDLYHRLDLLRVVIPPLRERGEDIRLMAEHLLEALCKRYRLPVPEITQAGVERLLSAPWPGNIRELAHELEREIVLGAGGKLDFSGLRRDESGRAPAIGAGLPEDQWLNPAYQFEEGRFDLEMAINELIQRAMEQSSGNVSAAARLLGVSRDYVRYRLKGS